MTYIAVFDTNILISALLSTNSHPFQCLALAKIRQIDSVTCQEILDEFSEKLLEKFKFSEEMVTAAVEEIRAFSRIVEISGMLRTVPSDPDDDMIIECALIGNVTHVVTGDKQILALKRYQGIVIVKAAEFVSLLSL